MIAPLPRDIPDLPPIPGVPVLYPSFVPASAVVAPVRRPAAAAFRALVAVAALTGVTLDLVVGSPARVLSHFAVQSAVLVAVVFAASARRAWTRRRPLPPLLTGGVLLYAMITALVHHLVLADRPGGFSITGATGTLTAREAAAGLLLHTVIPVAVVIDWLLLTRSDALRVRHAAIWPLYPLTYLAFSLLRGTLIPAGSPGRYLYPFVDAARHGYLGVLGYAALLTLAFQALALLVVATDHVRPDPARRHPAHGPETGFRVQPPVG
ncbi:Pr6Pr family membrane protein [Streptomyces sp. NPDC008313]|uniref:Pr6Pr family membrane protein n=1 Tax=Streptomyces sp. NPDC008313 TaxID=3364826 RepID=UPI0036E36B3B